MRDSGDNSRNGLAHAAPQARFASKRLVVRIFIVLLLLALCGFALFSSHEGEKGHPAPAVDPQDSLPAMHSQGVNTLISDSGVIRYRLVAEEWDIHRYGNGPTTWKFLKGLFMERFDEAFRVELFVQADTAYLHRQCLWELRGRVVIRNTRDEVFRTEVLFWDIDIHEMWSREFVRITTPERQLQGYGFRSNEQMTRYWITNSSGAFPVSDTQPAPAGEPADSLPGARTTPETAPETPSARQRATNHRDILPNS